MAYHQHQRNGNHGWRRRSSVVISSVMAMAYQLNNESINGICVA